MPYPARMLRHQSRSRELYVYWRQNKKVWRTAFLMDVI